MELTKEDVLGSMVAASGKVKLYESRLKKISQILQNLEEEIDIAFGLIERIKKDNEELYETAIAEIEAGRTFYPSFNDLYGNKDKAHLRRCVEVAETKLRRIREVL